jgi:hypothetical protein
LTVSAEPVAAAPLPASGVIEIEFVSGARLRIVGTVDLAAVSATIAALIADGPFQRGSIWANPDIDAAVEMMRAVYSGRDWAREIGELGHKTVMQTLTAKAVSSRLRGSLLDSPSKP